MYVKVEPTGCCERKGLVQVRFCMYLDENDYGYDKHHILVPIIPEEGYLGKVDEMGSPIDIKEYDTWVDSLPKVWQNNPFHNHFIYVKPETLDEEIMDIGEAHLHEAYIKWACELKHDLENPKVKFPSSFDKEKVKLKVKHLKETTLERVI